MSKPTTKKILSDTEKIEVGKSRLAHRVQLILNNIDVLGKAPRSRLYKPTAEATEKIFTAIQERLDHVKALFEGTSEEEAEDFSL